MRKITGGCLCGKVRYEVFDSFESFHLCHCLQCRKITGSSHASNLFTAPENMKILTGEEYIKNYSDPERASGNNYVITALRVMWQPTAAEGTKTL